MFEMQGQEAAARFGGLKQPTRPEMAMPLRVGTPHPETIDSRGSPEQRLPENVRDHRTFVPQHLSGAESGKTTSLTSERRTALLEGRELFNPGAIEESKLLVTEQTSLRVGQPLQVTWGGSWYAGQIIGFAEDGGVHIRYFGWAPSWDEIVPRAELRLDPLALERAINASLPLLNAGK